MIKAKSFISDSGWSLMGNASFIIGQACIMALIAKFLSVNYLGLYALGLAIADPVVKLTNLNLRSVQATDTFFTTPTTLFLRMRMITLLAATLLVCIIAMLFYREAIAVVVAAFFLRGAEAVSDIAHGNFQRIHKFPYLAISLILRSALYVICAFVCLSLGLNLVYMVSALAIVSALVAMGDTLVSYLSEKRREADTPVMPISSVPTLSGLFTQSVPVGLMQFATVASLNMPKYIIEHLSGAEALGYFAACAYFFSAGSVVVRSIGLVAVSRLANIFAKNHKKRHRNLSLQLIGFGFLAGLAAAFVMYFWGEQVLTLFYTEAYALYQPVAVIVMLGGAFHFSSGLLSASIVSTRNFSAQNWILPLMLASSLAMSYYFISKYNVLGAGYAFFFTGILIFALRLVVYHLTTKKQNVRVP